MGSQRLAPTGAEQQDLPVAAGACPACGVAGFLHFFFHERATCCPAAHGLHERGVRAEPVHQKVRRAVSYDASKLQAKRGGVWESFDGDAFRAGQGCLQQVDPAKFKAEELKAIEEFMSEALPKGEDASLANKLGFVLIRFQEFVIGKTLDQLRNKQKACEP